MGVQTSSKHFIGNEQETQRSNTIVDGQEIAAVSSNIDDRTLHELYLWPFADAIKAGTTSVMCSYNRVNSTYACENEELLNRILKQELGFRGYVVSDWFATHSTISSASDGLDMEMPGRIPDVPGMFPRTKPYFGDSLHGAVDNGSVSTTRLDEMVTRVLTPYFLLGQDAGYPSVDPSTAAVLAAQEIGGLPKAMQLGLPFQIVEGRDVRADHAELIRKIAAAGTVLLKNTANALPLQKPRNIAVFGNDAANLMDSAGAGGHGTDGWDIGSLYIGGGSGTARLEDTISPLEAIRARARRDNSRVKHITNNTAIAAGNFQSIYPLPSVCLVFLKTFAAESIDRTSYENDDNANAVVNSVASWCNNTVVVTHSAGVNTMPWATHQNVTAILAAHYPGEQSGNSIVDVLYGDVNPSGRLPYTIPVSKSDGCCAIVNLTDNKDWNAWQADFAEGQMIDYRWFDVKNSTPLYAFGFGLSYTTFEIASELAVFASQQPPTQFVDASKVIQIGGHPDLWEPLVNITTSVTNTGSRAGDAVPQLYISMPASMGANTPIKVLRGFAKVALEVGENNTVGFILQRRDLSFWDVVTQSWVLPSGEFTARVGFSSRDLRAETRFVLRS
jgi:beta-glucosidase